MTDSFPKALSFVLKWEGGFVCDPDDPGGATKWGISQKAHPDLDVANLTQEEAATIYKMDYWTPCGCDALPYPLDICIFDTAVNCGVLVAKRIRNEAKGDWKDVLFRRVLYYTLVVDSKPRMLKFFRGWCNRTLALWSEHYKEKPCS